MNGIATNPLASSSWPAAGRPHALPTKFRGPIPALSALGAEA